MKCDESAATSETDTIKKAPYSYCIERRNMQSPQKEGPSMSHTDCFIVSGSKVLEGVGRRSGHKELQRTYHDGYVLPTFSPCYAR